MSKFIKLLKRAHAIEIGAYHAYEGHWRSLPNDSVSQNTIKAIQTDELNHKKAVAQMLKDLNAKSSPLLDTILWLIGKSISIACHFMGFRMAMWGAKIMEIMGANIYRKLVQIAVKERQYTMALGLSYMQRAEEDHERYIKTCLEQKELSVQ